MATRSRTTERWMRHVGASLLAMGALVAAPFVLFALSYKTYIYSRTGHWYYWGAPTPIGTFNRVVSYALTANLIIGGTFLLSAWLLRVRRRMAERRADAAGPSFSS